MLHTRILAFLALLAGSALVHAACSVSVTPVAFGSYEAEQTAHLDATGAINVSCDSRRSEQVTVQFQPQGATPRAMVRGAEQLQYEFFSDAARTQVFASATFRVSFKKNEPIPVYGRIFGGQSVAPGQYAGTVNVTLLP